MLNILTANYKGDTAVLELLVPEVGVVSFVFQCPAAWVAELLAHRVREVLGHLMAAERRYYYNLGWKQARSHRARKRTWFPSNYQYTAD
jgi:hypothetical protein